MFRVRKQAVETGSEKKKNSWRETLEALITAFVIAFLIRSFVVEPFKIPSGSMIPTLLIGDHIFVNKFAYGIRIPFTKWWPVKGRDPKRGEVIVFIYPKDESLDFIKRVVGVPGDTIAFDGRHLNINGNPVDVAMMSVTGIDADDSRYLQAQYEKPFRLPYYREYDDFDIAVETLDSKAHLVQYYKAFGTTMPFKLTVPDDHFFVMGDNRDRSADSREWGLVPRENLKGEALVIWLSLKEERMGVRWERFGKGIR